MIKYQLICDQNHEFEGWFQTSTAFDEQAKSGLLRCPLCDSDRVKRALMTPNLASPKRRTQADPESENLGSEASNPAPHRKAGQVSKADQVQAFGVALAELRQLQQKITKDCRDVGKNFAEEARKIHYGETDADGIYGQTTREEREELEDEGIEIFDMPWLPPDQ